MTFTWTEENTNRAQKLWREGHSASYIGKVIGCGRSALLGKAYRMREHFPSRKDTVKRMRVDRQKAPKKLRAPVKRAPRIPAAPRERFEKPKHNAEVFSLKLTSKTLMELKDNDCRWPEGDRFCGKPKDGRRPYCKTHRPHGIAGKQYGRAKTNLR